MPQQPPPPKKSSVFLQLGRNLLSLAQLRAALFAVEFADEVEHTKRLLILAFAAAVFLVLGLLFVGLCAVVVFWDTHRTLAVFCVTLVYLAIGGALLVRVKALAALHGEAFAETRRELRSDLMLFGDANEHK